MALADQVLESSTGTAHFTADGATAECGSTATVRRTVKSAESFVTCAKCRKAHGLPFMVGPSGRPEFNTGHRTFGR